MSQCLMNFGNDSLSVPNLVRTLSGASYSRNPRQSSGIARWKKAVTRARANTNDPWKEFHLEKLPEQKAQRLKFCAKEKRWMKDEVLIKLDDREPFAKGAMRQCFRMKEMTTHLNVVQVVKASESSAERDELWLKQKNYVAKEYIAGAGGRDSETGAPTLLVEDVKMQMEAKMYADAFNAHKPPKPVDMLETFLVHVLDSGKWYLIESFQDGKYCKHNNNYGFVGNSDMSTNETMHIRTTPQAFSHFTFCESGGKLIIVDIQGVGDLYTDPQFHMIDGQGYGAGNMGAEGIAMFFKTFNTDNLVSEKLGLPKFHQPPHVISSISAENDSLAATALCKSKQLVRYLSCHGGNSRTVQADMPSDATLRQIFNTKEPTVHRDILVAVGMIRWDAGDVHGARFHWLEAVRQGNEIALQALRNSRFQWLQKIVDEIMVAVTWSPFFNVVLPAQAHTGRYELGLFPFVSTRHSLRIIYDHEGVMGLFRGVAPRIVEVVARNMLVDVLPREHFGWKIFNAVVRYSVHVLSIRMVLLPKQSSMLETLKGDARWATCIPNLTFFTIFGAAQYIVQYSSIAMTRSVLPGSSGSFLSVCREVATRDGICGFFAGTQACFFACVPCLILGYIGSIPLRLLSMQFNLPS